MQHRSAPDPRADAEPADERPATDNRGRQPPSIDLENRLKPTHADGGDMIPVAIAAYALAIISANLLVLRFGPPIIPLVAFFLIGLDLALRNWLNLRMRPVAMGLLILVTGLLTYLVNPAARSIAIAS